MTKRIVSKDQGPEMVPIQVEITVEVHEIPILEAMITGEQVAIQMVVPVTIVGVWETQKVSGLLTLFCPSTLLTGFKWTLGQFQWEQW